VNANALANNISDLHESGRAEEATGNRDQLKKGETEYAEAGIADILGLLARIRVAENAALIDDADDQGRGLQNTVSSCLGEDFVSLFISCRWVCTGDAHWF
jgi:hypothetical protein